LKYAQQVSTGKYSDDDDGDNENEILISVQAA
jgi:hypothetical protein